jgi:hypothetical protein
LGSTDGQRWLVDYVGNVNVADAIFVVVTMAMASSLPILRFTESVIAKVSAVGKGTPASWWLAILTLGPLLGSFITGPAAMTICALLLRHRFYSLKPSESLKYATLGLLFANISVGGVLTQFASPPVVKPWGHNPGGFHGGDNPAGNPCQVPFTAIVYFLGVLPEYGSSFCGYGVYSFN